MGWHSWYQSMGCLHVLHLHFRGSAWLWKSSLFLWHKYLCFKSNIFEVNLFLKFESVGSVYWEWRISQNFCGTSFWKQYSSTGAALFLIKWSWWPVKSIDKLIVSICFVGFVKIVSERGMVPEMRYVKSVEELLGTWRYLFQYFKWTLFMFSIAALLTLDVQIAAQYS